MSHQRLGTVIRPMTILIHLHIGSFRPALTRCTVRLSKTKWTLASTRASWMNKTFSFKMIPHKIKIRNNVLYQHLNMKITARVRLDIMLVGFVCPGLVGVTNILSAFRQIRHYRHYAFSHLLCLRLMPLGIFARIAAMDVGLYCHLDRPVNSRVMNSVR